MFALFGASVPTTAAPTPQSSPAATTFLYLADISRNYTGLSGRIVFETDRDGNTELYRLNAAGLDTIRLTNNAASDRDPAWSPDGTKIAFMSYRDGNYEIYVMNADGSGQLNVSKNMQYDGVPAWSPDGRHIAVTSRRGDTINLWAVTADGSAQRPLTGSTVLELNDNAQWHQ